MADQTHSAEIKVIEESDLGSGFIKNKTAVPVVDGFVTDMANVYIVIKGADCTPVLIYAKNENVVGGCHSGREGTRKGIVKELISKMVSEFHISVNDLVIMIGPAISMVNYQVSEDIYTEFVSSTGKEQDYRNIDMQKVIVRDALAMGINEENVILNNKCSFANPNFFSYRRDKTKNRQLSIIGITDGKIFE
jgi:YfiH family protein